MYREENLHGQADLTFETFPREKGTDMAFVAMKKILPAQAENYGSRWRICYREGEIMGFQKYWTYCNRSLNNVNPWGKWYRVRERQRQDQRDGKEKQHCRVNWFYRIWSTYKSYLDIRYGSRRQANFERSHGTIVVLSSPIVEDTKYAESKRSSVESDLTVLALLNPLLWQGPDCLVYQ